MEPNADKRILAFISLGLLIAALLVPFIIAAFGHQDLAGGFALVAGFLALLFGALSWSERIGETVTVLLLLFIFVGGTAVAIFTIIRTKQVRAVEQAKSQAALNQLLGERARIQTNAEATNYFVTMNGYLYHPINAWTEAWPKLTLAPEDIVLPAKISTNKYCITEVFKLSDLKSDELRKFTEKHLEQDMGILIGSNFMVALPYISSPMSNGEIVVDIPFSEADNVRLFADELGNK